jgi:WD40 repeat protein
MVHTVRMQASQTCLIFGRDGRTLFSGTYKGNEVVVISVETGRVLDRWKGHQGSVLSLAISPDGRFLASGGDDQSIRLWEVSSGRELARWQSHESSVTALTFGSDGMLLISGGADGTLKLWNLPLIRKELAALGLDW